LVAEAVRMARAAPLTTAVTALIVAAAVGVIVSTTGQTVAIERDVLGRIDQAGTRTIVIEDTSGSSGIPPGAVARISGLSGVEWAVGFGIASDVRVAGLDGAAPVPIRGLFGAVPPLVVTSPWSAAPGTALAGIEALRALGLATAAGSVQPVAGNALPLGVVGWLDAAPPLDFLDRALLTPADPDEIVVRIIVLARSADEVAALATAVRGVLDAADPSGVSVQTSAALVEVRHAVRGELGSWGRNLVSLVLGAGLVLTGLNVFGAVTTRRRDFGRRRALGASRADIVALVTVQTLVTAVIGAVIGAVAGSVVVAGVLGIAPEPEFGVAVGVLAILATAVAAVPPALVAAYRDPVRILRVA